MSTRYPPHAPKRAIATSAPDPNALYVVRVTDDAHSAPMLWDAAMTEWKRVREMMPTAQIRPWEFVAAENERKRG